jgi:poly(3-hydroxybutyrate) depolymerase
VLALTMVMLAGTTITHAQTPTWEEPADIVFQAEHDGSEQRYVLLKPKEYDPKKRYHLLLALHGHGSDRWQFVRDNRGECRAARDAALEH